MINIYNKVYSENGEDGIIEYLLSQCTDLSYKCLEIGVYDGVQCNTANLVKNKKYKGTFIDKHKDFNHEFYDKCDYSFINEQVESDNIYSIFKKYNLEYQYDVFSLDIDGIDYWILKELIDKNLFNSHIIVLEYQDIIGPEKSLTVPNLKNFNANDYDCYGGPNFAGASLLSYIKLLSEKYVFVGCESLGYNGFFLNKRQLKSKDMEIKNIKPCFEIEKVKYGISYRWTRTKDMSWVEV